MKYLALLFALSLSLCISAQDNDLTHNEELQKMRDEDQASRRVEKIDWSILSVEDEKRRERVLEILDFNGVQTAQDYRNAALIFQHGGDTTSSSMAVKMMQKSLEIDPSGDKWLLAAAIDRDKMYRGEPQVYGTQFKSNALGKMVQYDLDKAAVSDSERQKMGVPTLAEQKRQLAAMNKTQLEKLYSEGSSVDEILKIIKKEYKKDFYKSKIDVSEGGVNAFGYSLLGEKPEEALKIFKLNTELRPNASNPWDSLGECLLILGRKEEGIAAYTKSLELDPENTKARNIVESNTKEGK